MTGPGSSGLFAEEELQILRSLLSGDVSLETVSVTKSSLWPYLVKSRVPRSPACLPSPPLQPQATPPPKRKRLSSIFFLRGFRLNGGGKCCCKSKTLYSSESESSSPSNSNHSSPSRRNQARRASAPPLRLQRRESQPARINVVEQVVLCFACLFD
jgi:hypothetical protein